VCPTARSVQYQKARGYHAKVVERWNAFAKIQQDLFGADVLALKPGEPVLVVQATTGSHHSARREKLEAGVFVELWKGAGAQIEVWNWKQAGPLGSQKAEAITGRRERGHPPPGESERRMALTGR
jgi:hypothetical protein